MLESRMGFPFLTSKLSLLPRNATKGLIKNAINGVGFKQNYLSTTTSCQQRSTTSLLETYYGEDEWKELKECWKKSCLIVDQRNPEAIRVQKIMNVLLGTMHNGLGLEHGYTINGADLVGEGKKLVGVGRKEKKRRGNRFGLKYGTKHLEGLDWELMLLDLSDNNALYIPTGKIRVWSGAVEGLSDSQIAAIIAHDIGHGVAQHHGEYEFRFYWYFLVLKLVGVPMLVLAKIELFFSRRWELEADHIGLILMASAGYDPRAALDVFCEDDHECSLDSTHPSDKKRVKMLEKNMGKAVAIYEQVQAGQGSRVSFRRQF